MSQTSPNTLHYLKDVLHWGDQDPVDLSRWSNEVRQAPVFLYNLNGIQSRFLQMRKIYGSLHSNAKIFYAMKANSHPEVLQILREQGSGVDVVSAGEIQRALDCGFAPQDMIFSGVGKSKNEIELALQLQIRQINVESLSELQRIAEISSSKKTKATVVLRMNPNIDVKTHPYIATGLNENKFGLEFSLWPEIQNILTKNPQISLRGLSLHLGSQMTDLSGLREALRLTKNFFLSLQKNLLKVNRFDVGGGLGIFYEKQDFAKEEELLGQYAQIIREELPELLSQPDFELQTEPGRWLVGHSGILLMEVEYIKETTHKNFLIVNAGMHNVLRPALYQAYHSIFPLRQHPDRSAKVYDIVGPICESSDFLAKSRSIPECFEGEILILADVGAYGFSMASNYNLQVAPYEICLK